MDPQATSRYRATIVARARFVEDLLAERTGRNATQYVPLGAGLDTFAQRRPDLAARIRAFEVDRPGPRAWKRRHLAELGYRVPDGLVPVDFETGDWWERRTSVPPTPTPSPTTTPTPTGRSGHEVISLN